MHRNIREYSSWKTQGQYFFNSKYDGLRLGLGKTLAGALQILCPTCIECEEKTRKNAKTQVTANSNNHTVTFSPSILDGIEGRFAYFEDPDGN